MDLGDKTKELAGNINAAQNTLLQIKDITKVGDFAFLVFDSESLHKVFKECHVPQGWRLCAFELGRTTLGVETTLRECLAKHEMVSYPYSD